MKRSNGGNGDRPSESSVSDAVRELAKITGTRPGYCRHALTIIPAEDGGYVFVELEKVRFEDCGVPSRCILPRPTSEYRKTALRRLKEAAIWRTNEPGGWSSGYAKRGGN